jgi:hypothetical protein
MVPTVDVVSTSGAMEWLACVNWDKSSRFLASQLIWALALAWPATPAGGLKKHYHAVNPTVPLYLMHIVSARNVLEPHYCSQTIASRFLLVVHAHQLTNDGA